MPGAYGFLEWSSQVSEEMSSQMRGFPLPLGAAERALQAVETKCANTQKLERFCRIFRITSSFWDNFMHQTLLTTQRFHMFVRG